MTQPQLKAWHRGEETSEQGIGGFRKFRPGRPGVFCCFFSHQCILKTRSNFTVLLAFFLPYHGNSYSMLLSHAIDRDPNKSMIKNEMLSVIQLLKRLMFTIVLILNEIILM